MSTTKHLTNLVNEPLVSIVVGNYNYECFIGKAIDSALNQTYKNTEIIVVDDGSTDNSRAIISSYDDRVIPIFKENGGQPSNYNTGFAASRGQIICFLDSDDVFVPDKIAKIVQIFQSRESVDWCFHSLKLIDENDNLLPWTTTVNYSTCERDYRTRLQSGRIPPSLPPSPCLCFKRSLLEKILPMPTTKSIPGSDHYVKFMAVALSKGFVLNEALTFQRIHGNNMGTLRKDKAYSRAREYVFTGQWIRQEFPYFKKFANKLFAVGTASTWYAGNRDPENTKVIKDYLASSSWQERLEINLRANFYYLREYLKSFPDKIDGFQFPLNSSKGRL